MLVSNYMTSDPLTTTQESSLDSAITTMTDRGIRHLPVVDAGGSLVGLLSDRALLQETGWLPSSVRCRYQDQPSVDALVGDIMSTEPVTTSPGDDLLTAMSIETILQGSGALPVLDQRRLVGIVTEVDLLRGLLTDARQGRGTLCPSPKVQDLMSSPAFTITSAIPLSEAAAVMEDLEVRHLPVMGNAGLIGMISDRDLRRALGQGWDTARAVDHSMSYGATVIQADAPVTEAGTVLLDQRIGAMVVVEGNEIVGMLSVLDILDHAIVREREEAGDA